MKSSKIQLSLDKNIKILPVRVALLYFVSICASLESPTTSAGDFPYAQLFTKVSHIWCKAMNNKRFVSEQEKKIKGIFMCQDL